MIQLPLHLLNGECSLVTQLGDFRAQRLITEANFNFLTTQNVINCNNSRRRTTLASYANESHKTEILSDVIAFNYSNLLSGKSLRNLNNLGMEISIILARSPKFSLSPSFPARRAFYREAEEEPNLKN